MRNSERTNWHSVLVLSYLHISVILCTLSTTCIVSSAYSVFCVSKINVMPYSNTITIFDLKFLFLFWSHSQSLVKNNACWMIILYFHIYGPHDSVRWSPQLQFRARLSTKDVPCKAPHCARRQVKMVWRKNMSAIGFTNEFCFYTLMLNIIRFSSTSKELFIQHSNVNGSVFLINSIVCWLKNGMVLLFSN